MDEYGWGLTSAGFRRPTYNELLDALEHKARELFGATANLTVRSPLGLFLRIFAWIHFYRKPLEYAQMVLRRRWSIIFPSAAPMAGRRVCSLIIA